MNFVGFSPGVSGVTATPSKKCDIIPPRLRPVAYSPPTIIRSRSSPKLSTYSGLSFNQPLPGNSQNITLHKLSISSFSLPPIYSEVNTGGERLYN